MRESGQVHYDLLAILLLIAILVLLIIHMTGGGA